MFTTSNYFREYLCYEISYENEKDIQQNYQDLIKYWKL
jgi:hypothetical protein